MFRISKFEDNGTKTVAFFVEEYDALLYVDIVATNPDNWKQEYKIVDEGETETVGV